MNVVIIQRCLLLPVTVILLLNTVDGRETTLSATSNSTTFTWSFSELIMSDENNTILITAQDSGGLVRLSVNTSEPLNQTQCDGGGSEVYSEDPQGTRYYMGTFCGGSFPETFEASHSTIIIILDNAMEDLGNMTLSYEVIKYCSRYWITASRNPRYIRTPGYPNGGIPPQFSNCRLGIRNPSYGRVRILLKFATPNYSPDCDKSNVTITEDYHEWTWCSGPQNGYTSWDFVTWVQTKGLEHLMSGLEMEIESVPGERCIHYIDADNITSDVFTTPGYPHGYEDYLECRWEIRMSQKRSIRITVLDSDMDGSPNCTRDNVRVYATYYVFKGALVKTWCGTQKPSIEVYRKAVLLIFKVGSGYNYTHRGLKFKYDVSSESSCGGTLTAFNHSQQLNNVGYPKPFMGYHQCIWYIRASDPLKVVLLSVVDSDLYYDYDCEDEGVFVYDGWTATDPQLGRWCGSSRPRYRSHSPKMMVVFRSDRTNTQRKGFIANYTEDMCTVEKDVSLYSAWITSPGYPVYSPSEQNCFWKLSTSQDSIAIRFTDLDIRCPADSIRIYDGESSVANHVCGIRPYSYLSKYQTIRVHLQTQTNRSKGFNLTYWRYKNDGLGCGTYVKVLYTNTSRLVWHFPGYPGNLFNRVICRWRFSGFSRVRLEISVNGNQGQNGNSCGGNHISVYDGSSESSPAMYNKLCRDVTIESSEEEILVQFATDGTNKEPGFTFYYQGFEGKTTTVRIYESPPTSRRVPGSTTIIVSILVPLLVVLVFVLVCVYSVTHKRASNTNQSVLGDDQGRILTNASLSNNQNNQSDPDSHNTWSDAPPSYIELQHKNNTDLHPPTYSEAHQGGMIVNTDQVLFSERL